MNNSIEKDTDTEARRMKTVWWILCLATFGLIFDGYDLVVYGAVVSTFLRDASHIGTVTLAFPQTCRHFS
jgi:AAHS family benzoate transporter-like MFS transporter